MVCGSGPFKMFEDKSRDWSRERFPSDIGIADNRLFWRFKVFRFDIHPRDNGTVPFNML